MRYRVLVFLPVLAFVALHAFAGAGVNSELQDDINDNGHGIISDYAGMHEGDDIDWLWVASGVTLADHGCKLGSYENATVKVDHDMDKVFKENLPEVLHKVCTGDASGSPLNVDVGVYWTERANSAKRWIPFAGGHLAQAGVGAEFVFTNSDGQVVAKVRHSAREGRELRAAAEEVADDLAEFIQEH